MEEYKKMQQPFLDKNNEPIQMGVNDNLEKLKALFPSVVKDGFVDFTALKEELGEIEEVGDEKYNFTWWGKQGAKIEAKTPPVGKTLNYKENGNDNFKGETENLYIEGDNLEVLKLLKENYYGKIKMIYIDPPYNTGKDFVYKDNFHMSKEESDKVEGLVNDEGERLERRFTENTKGNRYHSNWLTMMYPRLKVAQTLLRDDGVIFISIDDNEVHNLRKVCDEVFGEENFVAQISWKRKNEVANDNTGISKNIEYAIVYVKTNSFELNNLPLSKEYIEKSYKKPNSIFSKGYWRGVSIAVTKGMQGGGYKYDIVTPTGKVISDKLWTYKEESFKKLIDNNLIYFGVNNDSLPQRVIYANESKGVPPQNYYDSYKTKDGTKLLASLFNGNSFFDYVKPMEYIKHFLFLATNPNDIILDFFSGSATTAHAVMDLNAQDGGNRKFILAQLQEETDEKSEAYKNGYSNICEIGKERIRRAGNKIVEELEIESKKYLSENTQTTINSVLLNENAEADSEGADKDKYLKNPELLDIGFKVFEVGKTNIKWNDINSIEDVKTIEELQLQGKDRFDFMPHFTDVNVVYEIALQHRGVPLSSSLEKLTNIGERTYLYANSYLVCLEEDITEEIIKKISQISPQPISYYFRDSAFGENIALKDDTIRTFKDLISINYGNNKGSYTLEFI